MLKANFIVSPEGSVQIIQAINDERAANERENVFFFFFFLHSSSETSSQQVWKRPYRKAKRVSSERNGRIWARELTETRQAEMNSVFWRGSISPRHLLAPGFSAVSDSQRNN